MNKKTGARGQRRVEAEAELGAGAGGAHAPPSHWQVDAGTPVSRYMQTDVAYLRDNMWVDAAVSFLETHGLHDAPVLDQEGRPVGVLYADDVETEAAFVELGETEGPGLGFGSVNEELTLAQMEARNEERFTSLLLRRHGLGTGFHLEGGPRLRVRDVMVPYVPEIAADSSIATAALVMRDNQLGHVMVVGDDGRAVGMFAREDLVRWLVEETHRRPAREAGTVRNLRDVMRPVIAIRRRATLTTARDLMTTHDLAELPVVESGQVVGVVTESEITTMLNAHREDDGWMQELLVEDVMNAPALLGAPSDAVDSVNLDSAHGGCVLVVEHGRLIGIVTGHDLAASEGLRNPRLGAQLSY